MDYAREFQHIISLRAESPEYGAWLCKLIKELGGETMHSSVGLTSSLFQPRAWVGMSLAERNFVLLCAGMSQADAVTSGTKIQSMRLYLAAVDARRSRLPDDREAAYAWLRNRRAGFFTPFPIHTELVSSGLASSASPDARLPREGGAGNIFFQASRLVGNSSTAGTPDR